MEKEFIALTPEERLELKEFCDSEATFNQMKEVFAQVESMTFDVPTPKAETKEKLDLLFDATYPKVAPIWYMSLAATVVPKSKQIHRQPLVQAAAIALLLFLAFPLLQKGTLKPSEPTQVAVVDAPKTPEFKVEQPQEKPVNAVVAEEPAAPKVNTVQLETRDMNRPVSVAASPSITVSAASTPHPDGVFIAVSQPASQAPEMLDLLTTTF